MNGRAYLLDELTTPIPAETNVIHHDIVVQLGHPLIDSKKKMILTADSTAAF
jgi:hypothetical protein